MTKDTNREVSEFTIAIPDEDLEDLSNRLSHVRWPEEEPVDGWVQGAPLSKLRALCDYWRHQYDWRRCERMLNGWNSKSTVIDGLQIQFFHVRSPEPDALPVVMTHGWPGSAIEFHKAIAPLTDPRSHGGDPSDAFDLVIPALPGYGFSGKPAETGWGTGRTADAWIELMRRLGYEDRWAAQGGDWGAQVTAQIGRKGPEGCVGIHLNNYRWPPSESEIATADEYEQELVERSKRFENELSGYMREQGTRPQTIGYALADSPVGQAAWIYEKYRDWTDNSGEPESIFSVDEMLDNIMMYWVTNSGASSARFYWERLRDQPFTWPVLVPTAFSMFPKDIGGPSRRWAEEQFKNIVRWIETPRGGHHAAFEQPELFVEEVRAGLRAVQRETTRRGAS